MGAIFLVFFFVLSGAREARAYCRAITEYAPAGFDPADTGTCFAGDGQALQLYWRNRCVSYSVQKDASPLRGITFDAARAVAAEAFGLWNQVSCAGMPVTVHASEMEPSLGGTECDEVQYNEYGPNQHVIVFRDGAGWGGDASNTLGLTTISYDTTTGEIFDADMEINSHDFALAVPPAPPGAYDLLTIMTHEAGHFLGLAHSAERSAIMATHYTSGADALTAYDVAGLCSIDPPDATRSTSLGAVPADACDPTPRHGFTSACAPEDDAGHVLRPADAGTPLASEDASVTSAGTAAEDGAATARVVSWLPPPRNEGGSCALARSGGARPRVGWAAVVLASVLAVAGRRRGRRPAPRAAVGDERLSDPRAAELRGREKALLRVWADADANASASTGTR